MWSIWEIMTYNHPIIRMIWLLHSKWRLTSKIINNITWMLLEESCVLLEKNKYEEYTDVKNVLKMVESLDIE